MAPALPQIERPRTPLHVAIIMDGNGRWAQARGLPRVAGHQRGVEAVRRSVEGARELGVSHLTLYAFSSENWKRPRTEVEDLMGLLRFYVKRELDNLHRNQVRLRFIGDSGQLAPDIVSMIGAAEEQTANNAGLNLTIALNYGSHYEIATAARHLAEQVRLGRLQPEQIDEALFERHLQTAGLPEPDLLIRTSGEKRLSNFLLWQCAYTEFVFLDTLWPDFTKRDLEEAVNEFHRRERRYGATLA